MKIEKSTETLKDTTNYKQLDYEDNIQNSNPRVDITSQITDTLINDLSNKDWKVMKIQYFMSKILCSLK